MMLDPDSHGRSPGDRGADRGIVEMLGLVRGVILDGSVSVEEAHQLARWVSDNPGIVDSWPGQALAGRLFRIFADGRVDDEEREDLLYFLRKLVGPDAHEPAESAPPLPLDAAPPSLMFTGEEFVFTGRFIWGTRASCERAVSDRGGIAAPAVTRRTRVLVVGDLGSRDWARSPFRRNIEQAVEYRAAGVPIVIVDEQHWFVHLGL